MSFLHVRLWALHVLLHLSAIIAWAVFVTCLSQLVSAAGRGGGGGRREGGLGKKKKSGRAQFIQKKSRTALFALEESLRRWLFHPGEKIRRGTVLSHNISAHSRGGRNKE